MSEQDRETRRSNRKRVLGGLVLAVLMLVYFGVIFWSMIP